MIKSILNNARTFNSEVYQSSNGAGIFIKVKHAHVYIPRRDSSINGKISSLRFNDSVNSPTRAIGTKSALRGYLKIKVSRVFRR